VVRAAARQGHRNSPERRQRRSALAYDDFGAMLSAMLTVHLPPELGSQVQARASASGTTSDDIVADALRREACARRVFGEVLDVSGGELDEEELLALSVALVRQTRRERSGR
jgi:hypothetical protein